MVGSTIRGGLGYHARPAALLATDNHRDVFHARAGLDLVGAGAGGVAVELPSADAAKVTVAMKNGNPSSAAHLADQACYPRVMRPVLLVGFLPLLMVSGSCGGGSPSPGTDAAAGGAGGGGTTGTGGTSGAGGGSASCADKYEPIEATAARFMGNWLLDEGRANASCGSAFMVTFGPWLFNPASIPSDPAPIGDCPGIFLLITPKRLTDACTVPAICPTEQAASGFFVHPYPKTPPDFGPGPLAKIMVKAASDQPWTLTDRTLGIDKKDPHKMTLDDKGYTSTGINSGSCMPP
jgi:hypothetical protein